MSRSGAEIERRSCYEGLKVHLAQATVKESQRKDSALVMRLRGLHHISLKWVIVEIFRLLD